MQVKQQNATSQSTVVRKSANPLGSVIGSIRKTPSYGKMLSPSTPKKATNKRKQETATSKMLIKC